MTLSHEYPSRVNSSTCFNAVSSRKHVRRRRERKGDGGGGGGGGGHWVGRVGYGAVTIIQRTVSAAATPAANQLSDTPHRACSRCSLVWKPAGHSVHSLPTRVDRPSSSPPPPPPPVTSPPSAVPNPKRSLSLSRRARLQGRRIGGLVILRFDGCAHAHSCGCCLPVHAACSSPLLAEQYIVFLPARAVCWEHDRVGPVCLSVQSLHELHVDYIQCVNSTVCHTQTVELKQISK